MIITKQKKVKIKSGSCPLFYCLNNFYQIEELFYWVNNYLIKSEHIYVIINDVINPIAKSTCA